MSFHVGARTRYLALLVLLVGCGYAVLPTRSFACSCVPPGSPAEELVQAAAVFRGEAVAVRTFLDGGAWSSEEPMFVKFRVETVWKGAAPQTRYITTRRSGASCGYQFVEGLEYVVYSRNGWSVSLCSRTRPLAEAARDLADLGPGQPPAAGTMGLMPLVTALSILILGGAWIGRRKRRADAR